MLSSEKRCGSASRSSRRWLGFALVGIFAVASAGRASAVSFTVQELVDGASFETDNLSFSNFSASVTGALSPFLSDYEVVMGDDGFDLVGPIGVADGEVGDLLLQYDVSVLEGGNAIVAGLLLFNGTAAGIGAQANVSELYIQDSSTAFVRVTGGGTDDNLADGVSFGDGYETLTVVKDIQVDSLLFTLENSLGGAAAISLVVQDFTVVPEPATLSLMLLGLGGIAFVGTRRSS